jgi:hypothetical protein
LLLALVSTVVLGIGTHDRILVLSRLFCVLKFGPFFDERRDLTMLSLCNY